MMVCVWRIPDERADEIEAVIGTKIGEDFPYAAPGWETEADAKNWISERALHEIPEFANGWTHGTPEKLHSVVATHNLIRVERIGDWPRAEIVNDDESILNAALATSPLGGSERPNRHIYRTIVSPKITSSWRSAVDGFLAFIAFEPAWHAAAQQYLSALDGQDVRVELHAFDKKHFFYGVHQARAHTNADLGFFEIIVRVDDQVFDGLYGHYAWDGETRPTDAVAAIEAVYGNTTWATLSIWSAVDNNRYEAAIPMHGFAAVIDHVSAVDEPFHFPPLFRNTLHDFVAANPDYCREVSETLELIGPLPTDPTG